MYRDASRVLEQLLKSSSSSSSSGSSSGSSKSGKKRKRNFGGDGKQEDHPNDGQQLGLKSLALADKVKNKSKTYAVVCETLKYKDAIDQVLREAKIEKRKIARNEGLLYAMLYDHLFGKGIRGGGAVKRGILEHKHDLQVALERVMEKRKVTEKEDLIPEHVRKAPSFPRYARINLFKLEIKSALEKLESTVHNGIKTPSFKQDEHIPYLVKFPPKTDLHDHPMVLNGEIVLQDKSSCFPAHALHSAINEFGTTKQGDSVSLLIDAIDATAAPGNKTSQLASFKEQIGKVFAFDKSDRRLDILKTRMKQGGLLCPEKVNARCADFLNADPADKAFSNVRVILLDPSCSGSGMIGRVDHLVQSSSGSHYSDEIDTAEENGQDVGNEKLKKLDDRLNRLSSFQKECLDHAMKFSQVEFISYSTCSVHEEENEQVVADALQKHPEFKLVKALPDWHRRGQQVTGVLDAEQAARLVRVDPREDLTCGFFVALFRRQSEAELRKKQKMRERRKKRRRKGKQ